MPLIKPTREQLRAHRAAGMPRTARFSTYTGAQLDAVEEVLSVLAEAEARGEGALPALRLPSRQLSSTLQLFDRVELLVETMCVPAGSRGVVVHLMEPDGCIVEFFTDADEQQTIEVYALNRCDAALILPDVARAPMDEISMRSRERQPESGDTREHNASSNEWDAILGKLPPAPLVDPDACTMCGASPGKSLKALHGTMNLEEVRRGRPDDYPDTTNRREVSAYIRRKIIAQLVNDCCEHCDGSCECWNNSK